MSSRPDLKVVSVSAPTPRKPPAQPSRTREVVNLAALLFISLVLWAGVIWYCIEMWKARS